MSLVVWLPLTKDTRQQGLSNISVTGTPASWENGKLGKCATWNGAVANVLYNNTTDFNYTNNFSVAFWANPIYTGSTAQYAWTVGRADAGGYGYGFQIISATTAQFRFGNGSYGVSAPSNEWHHFVMTIGNSKVTIYKDGIQVGSNNLPGTIPTYSDGNGMGLGCFHYSGNIYPYYGSLNDFRIYDHCLSPMEVKELAKGLVLHYPLNRQGWGQENLVWDTHWDEISTKWSGWGSPPVREIVNTFGKKYLHVKSSDRWQGYSQNQAKRSGVGEITAGEKLTLSCWAYSNTTLTSYPCIGIHWTDGSSIIAQSWPLLTITTTPQKFITVLTVPSGVSAFNIMVGNGSGTVSGVYEIWVADVKLERGEIATPWCPNSSDTLATTMGLNSTTEYDCSGFCNNGTRTNTLTYTSDTPKYNISTNFAATGTIINNTSPIHLSNEFTIAWWGKVNSWKKNWEGMFLLQNNATLNAGTSTYDIMSALHASTANSMSLTICQNGSSYAFDKYKWTYTIGVWAHYACTYKAGVITIYQNGTSIYTETITDNSSNDYYYRLGHRANFCDCQMSDFRIYATALSASDVKSLYQNCATIDPDGTIRGQIRS